MSFEHANEPTLILGEAVAAPGEPSRYRVVWSAWPSSPELGRGGIGRVLRAFDERIGREVALKELLPPPGRAVDPRVEERFLREAKIAGRLEHPNIIPIYDVGRRCDGRPFFTMKLVRGRTLSAALDACPTLVERMLLLPHLVDVGRAVAHAHAHGVVHCDLKPDNVMIGEFGETVLLDWGLAHVAGLEDVPLEVAGPKLLRGASLAHGSLSGRAIGTPAYLSPEQAEGRVSAIDERSDVWGLGAILYELLTGWPPYHAETPEAALAKVRTRDVTPVRLLEPLAPASLATLAERVLRRDPRERFFTARQCTGRVEGFLPSVGRPVSPPAAGPASRGGVAGHPGRFSLPEDGVAWQQT